MKLQTTFLALLSATLASSSVLRPDSKQTTVDPPYKVPGKNPLNYCADPSTYIGQIEYVDLIPNPPVPGQKLQIVANGTFSEDIVEGATVHLQVKYNHYITLINTQADLCENLPRIDLECPIKKGPMSVMKEVDIPRQVPPGKYEVSADVKAENGEVITCMTAEVVFSRA